MPGTTAKGVPYAQGGDAAATIDDTMQALANVVDARPGVSPLTTAQRDALAGADLWDGRVIWNKTTARLERYILGTNTWVEAIASVVLDFGEVGDISASAPGDAAAAGATGEVADAGHRHAREAAPTAASLGAASLAQYDELRLQRILSPGASCPNLRNASSGALPAAQTTFITVAAGRKYVLKNLTLVNWNSTVANTINIILNGTTVVASVNLAPNATLPIPLALVMNAGDTLAFSCSNANFSCNLAYADLPAADTPARYMFGTVAAVTAWTTFFTAAANIVITHILIGNTAGAARQVSIGKGTNSDIVGPTIIPAGGFVNVEIPLYLVNGDTIRTYQYDAGAANQLTYVLSGYPAAS